MQASSVIRSARELDPSFTRQRHTDRVALGSLSRLHRRFVEDLVKLEPRAVVDELEITFPLDDFDGGAPLETGESDPEPIDYLKIHRPLDLWRRGEDLPRRLDLIDWADRHRTRGWACWLREGRLFFTGSEEAWNDVTKVVLTYTPSPTDLDALEDELLLPSSATGALVTGLGAFFASRSKADELAKPRAEFRQEALEAERLWLDGIYRRIGAVSSRTREVW